MPRCCPKVLLPGRRDRHDASAVDSAQTEDAEVPPGAECDDMNTRSKIERSALMVLIIGLVVVAVPAIAAAQTSQEGTASFYSDKFQGKKTSSGESYDKNGLTASHKTLAFGTKIKVTNVANGKSVMLTVNDRMKKSNPALIEVSRRAADELGFAKAGKAKVKLEVEK